MELFIHWLCRTEFLQHCIYKLYIIHPAIVTSESLSTPLRQVIVTSQHNVESHYSRTTKRRRFETSSVTRVKPLVRAKDNFNSTDLLLQRTVDVLPDRFKRSFYNSCALIESAQCVVAIIEYVITATFDMTTISGTPWPAYFLSRSAVMGEIGGCRI